jgi:hypothetical protein
MPRSIVTVAAAAVAGLVLGLAVPATAAPAAARPEPAGWSAPGSGWWLPTADVAARPAPQPAPLPAPLAGAGAAGSWRVQPTPNPVMPNGSLGAVSCTKAAGALACTAVGGYENRSGTGLTLAERWTGGRWAVQATPNPAELWSSLSGVSCLTATDCTAVGWSVTAAGREVSLAQQWDGRRWTVRPVPSPAGATDSGLFGVSCSAPRACTAVGEYVTAAGAARSLAVRWNGSRWTIQPIPVPSNTTDSELSGVSCGPGGTCLAAGAMATASSQLTLAERWDGTSWHVTATPEPAGALGSGFTAISCGAPASCVAVGSYGVPSADGSPAALAEAWNGTTWHLMAVPVPPPGPQSLPASAFDAVSCTSPTACDAVGGYSPGAGLVANLAESWNGTRWVIKPAPDPAGNIGSGLAGISCTAADTCEAAGTYYVEQPIVTVGGVAIPGLALAESWNGTRWTTRSARNQAGAGEYSELNAIACASARACAAIGDQLTSKGLFAPLAERWTGGHRTGGRWTIQPVVNPAANAESFLQGISCPTPASCTAVGFTTATSGTITSVALAERWDGKRWRIEPTPLPAHALGDQLFAVACPSASDCLAVGDYLKGQAPLAEQWNGTRWRVLAVPVAAGTGASALSAISCEGPRACTAVGYRLDASGNQWALAETWNGTRWRQQAITSPAGTALSGLACTTPRACTAVGAITTDIPGPKGGPGSTTSTPFAERWNGTRWTREAVPSPSPGGWLSAVSCAGPRACTAAGGASTANGATVLLGEAWNGTRWAIAPAANPAPAFDSVLNGIACTAPRACTAVGSYLAMTNVTVTLAMASLHDKDLVT